MSAPGPGRARRGLEVAGHPRAPRRPAGVGDRRPRCRAGDSTRGSCQAGLVGAAGTSRPSPARAAPWAGRGARRPGSHLAASSLGSGPASAPQCPPPPLLPLVPETAACKMAPRRGGPGAGSRGAARPRAGLGTHLPPRPRPPPSGLPTRQRVPLHPGTRGQASPGSRPLLPPWGSLCRSPHVPFIFLSCVEIDPPSRSSPSHLLLGTHLECSALAGSLPLLVSPFYPA